MWSVLANDEARMTSCSFCHDTQARVGTSDSSRYAIASRCPACRSADPCAECDGVGYTLFLDEVGMPVTRICACRADGADARMRLYNVARVPARYASSTVNDFDEQIDGVAYAARKSAKLRVIRLLESFTPGDKGLCFSGTVGIGKTHLCAAIIRALTLMHGVGCRFVEFSGLLQDIKRVYDGTGTEADVFDPLVDVPVLVIDELGKGLRTDWQQEILDLLIGRRYENQRATTFCTTNFGWTEAQRRTEFKQVLLPDRLGVRVFSRVSAMCELVAIDGPDYRRRGTT